MRRLEELQHRQYSHWKREKCLQRTFAGSIDEPGKEDTGPDAIFFSGACFDNLCIRTARQLSINKC